jgi:hypothetical protein
MFILCSPSCAWLYFKNLYKFFPNPKLPLVLEFWIRGVYGLWVILVKTP